MGRSPALPPETQYQGDGEAGHALSIPECLWEGDGLLLAALPYAAFLSWSGLTGEGRRRCPTAGDMGDEENLCRRARYWRGHAAQEGQGEPGGMVEGGGDAGGRCGDRETQA